MQRKVSLISALLRIVGIALFLSSNLILVAQATSPPPQPTYPEGESQYFSSVGHYVDGPFLDFYRKRGGTRIFGYPQTERFYDAQSGLWVQYFDNVRMEWHVQNPEPYQVQLGLLGEILGYRTPAIPASQAPRGNPFRRYFPETGHVVSFAFLSFYDNNGGLDIFGYPISEPMVENGRIVQYFQRARMEWHPERPRDERVVLGSLGMEYIQEFGVPSIYRERQPPQRPSTSPPTPGDVTSIRVWPFVRNVITGREGSQTVYVYVTDEARQPVSGVVATVIVHFPSQPEEFTTDPTDSRGITDITFPITALPPGRKIIIDVEVQFGDQVVTGQTFFVPWY